MPVLVPLRTVSFFGADAYAFVVAICVVVLFLARAVFFGHLRNLMMSDVAILFCGSLSGHPAFFLLWVGDLRRVRE